MKFFRNILLTLLLCFTGMAFAADAVNINNADAATLMKALKGVGPDKASAIIAYREQHGPFKSADQLSEVKGIGKKLVEMNREVIMVGEAEQDNQ
jgi:competence protein ComEA